MAKKSKIYFKRTYRHLGKDIWGSALYLLLFVIPLMVGFILSLPVLTNFICQIGVSVLAPVSGADALSIKADMFSNMGDVYFLEIPTVYPEKDAPLWSLLVIAIAGIFMLSGRRKGNPLSIYGLLTCFTHLVNSLFFLLVPEHFPYTATQFSDLYMKQQVGIWITFLALSGLVTVIMGRRRFFMKGFTVLAIITYSVIFGALRYITFLYLIQRFSIFYMALMYFVFGPAFDFLYFVAIYGIFAEQMVKEYVVGSGREEWEWL